MTDANGFDQSRRGGRLFGSMLYALVAAVVWACGPAESADDLDGLFKIGATIEVGAAPHGIRFSADGDTAYVALSGDGQIAVVDLTGPAVVARWDAGTTPLDLIRAGDGWLVSQFRDSTLVALDAEGRIVPGAVWNVGAGPSLFTPGTVRGQAWLTSEFADRLWVVNTGTGAPAESHATGDRPYPADVMWDGSHAFVPNLDAGTVSVIDLLNMETDATVEVVSRPGGRRAHARSGHLHRGLRRVGRAGFHQHGVVRGHRPRHRRAWAAAVLGGRAWRGPLRVGKQRRRQHGFGG